MKRRLGAGALCVAGLLLLTAACSSGSGYSKATSAIAPAGRRPGPVPPPFRVGPLATGKADAALAAPPSLDYIFETLRLVRHSGHWAITSLADATLPQASARQCQP
jgi:hypothetical protein